MAEEKKYLDYPGLQYYHGLCRQLFLESSDVLGVSKEDIDALFSVQPAKQGAAEVTLKTEGTYLGVNYADLGTFKIDGLNITGVAKKATSPDFDGVGKGRTGYFLGMHIDNLKLLKTAKNTEGKPGDESGDWLIYLGETPTLSYFDVVDTSDKTDRYLIDILADGTVQVVTQEALVEFANKLRELYPTKEDLDMSTLLDLEAKFDELLGEHATLQEALDELYLPKAEAASKTDIEDMLTKTEAQSTYETSVHAEETYATKASLTEVYKVKGTVAFADLTGQNIEANKGNVYNISDKFTTDERFKEGTGQEYPAGTNVVVVEDGGECKFDALAGTYDFSDFVKDVDLVAISNEEIDALFAE